MRMRAQIVRKMSFDLYRNYLRKWIEIDPDWIWFGTMSVQRIRLDNVSSVDRPLLNNVYF